MPAAGVWRVHSQRMYPFLSQPDFWAMVKSNLWDGQSFSLLWAWGYGRFFQTASLFLLGMLDGTHSRFANLSGTSGFRGGGRAGYRCVRSLLCPVVFHCGFLPDMIPTRRC
ncbi:MAG: hypothetical protein ACLRS8_18975 [Parabacteroides merdae]